MRTTATARVQVTVMVELNQSWGPDCPIGQVRAQASREAQEAVQRAIMDVRGLSAGPIVALEVVIAETP